MVQIQTLGPNKSRFNCRIRSMSHGASSKKQKNQFRQISKRCHLESRGNYRPIEKNGKIKTITVSTVNAYNRTV